MSELYTKRQEVLQDTKRLQEASRNLRRYANNVQDAVREQEILTMKMRIHEEIGSSLTAVERILVQNKPLTQADPVIARWKDNLWMLEKDDGQEAHKDYLTELCELCGSMNLRVITTGRFPEEPGAHYLLITAMRVCATNAVRHAGATELYADIRTGGESATAVITNNGTPPAGPPAEGGGLGNLRRRIEDVGGRKTVRADSGFELTATVAVAQEVYL